MGSEQVQNWNSRGHFFAAAAEAMRRILIENARRKTADKRGGQRKRVSLDHADAVAVAPPDELLAFDEALERLERHDPVAGKLVKLRYYAGLSLEHAAERSGFPPPPPTDTGLSAGPGCTVSYWPTVKNQAVDTFF